MGERREREEVTTMLLEMGKKDLIVVGSDEEEESLSVLRKMIQGGWSAKTCTLSNGEG